MKKSLLATMKTELQKAQQIHSQTSQQYPLYDLDLGKLSEKVTQLTDRWQRIDKQIDYRCAGPASAAGDKWAGCLRPPRRLPPRLPLLMDLLLLNERGLTVIVFQVLVEIRGAFNRLVWFPESSCYDVSWYSYRE